MRVLYYECLAGLAGDMNLGAMLDLGIEASYLKGELSKLGLDHAFELKIDRKDKLGITGYKVDVILKEDAGMDFAHSLDHKHDHHQDHDHSHDHHHDHDHSHDHHHAHDHSHSHEHHHRDFGTIRQIIETSGLEKEVKALALEIFKQVAKAEAKVHGKAIDEVHFHEVGAMDSIVDIVGAAICYHALGIDYVMASPVEVGGGYVKCAHGLMPVPAPATAKILEGVPITMGRVPFELTTPTGAAILKVLVKDYVANPKLTILKTGYGLGTRDLEIPNLVRVMVGEVEDQGSGNLGMETHKVLTSFKDQDLMLQDKIFEIQTNLDDMNPETFEYLEALLFNQGALDVFKTGLQMKKSRLGVGLTVLAYEEDLKELVATIFNHSTAIGVRYIEKHRFKLPRSFYDIPTPFGPVQVKVVRQPNGQHRYKAEYDSVVKTARAHEVSLGTIYEVVEGAWQEQKNKIMEKLEWK